jgi:transposase InsO family protein
MDLYSRRIVGWSMSRWMSRRLVVDALRMALAARRPKVSSNADVLGLGSAGFQSERPPEPGYLRPRQLRFAGFPRAGPTKPR